MDQDPKPVRKMSDIGSRRTLDLRSANTKKTTAKPVKSPAPVKSQPRPASASTRAQSNSGRQQRPVASPARATAASGMRPSSQRQTATNSQPGSQQKAQVVSQQATQAPSTVPKKGNGWKIILQFVIGLVVILGVAVSIVALYVKYYQ